MTDHKPSKIQNNENISILMQIRNGNFIACTNAQPVYDPFLSTDAKFFHKAIP